LPAKDTGTDFESAVKRLEEIVSKLGDQALPLDEALKLFEEGIGASRNCADHLETAKARVEKLVEQSPGVFSLEAFDGLTNDQDSDEDD
jgi:exodeoxyribonuclease VII small subunit